MKHLNWKCQKESLMQRSAIRLLFCADMRGGRDEDIHRMIIEMQNMQKKLLYAKSVEQVMGYEGTAAKI